MRYFAIVGDDNSVVFGQSNVKEEDTPENYHEIAKDKYDKYTEDPEKARGYSWKNDKVVYTKPPDEPKPTPKPSEDTRIAALESTIEKMERRLKSVEQRKEKGRGA
jgi:hypothetical protein